MLEKELCNKPDIKGLFDNSPHKLIFKSLEQYNLEKWKLLYIGRLLEISDVDNKKCGSPQGGVISPLLANVFMDVCFDKWMKKNYSKLEFCRYADDCIIHCVTEKQVFYILGKVKARFLECGLELNADKTILANTKCKKSTYQRIF